MYDIPSVLDQHTLPALQTRCKRNRTPHGVRVQDCTVFTSLLDKHMDTEALHAPLGHWRLFPMSNLLTCVHDSQFNPKRTTHSAPTPPSPTLPSRGSRACARQATGGRAPGSGERQRGQRRPRAQTLHVGAPQP